jgi:hypothetical protein
MLKNNMRLEITIQPWAIRAADGSRLSEAITGLWFTKLLPLYSSVFAVEAEAGKATSTVPDSLIQLAIFEASRYTDAIAIPTCPNPNLVFFQQIRWRYVTLRAILMLAGGLQGLGSVSKKALGDFEIQFNVRDGDHNPISRLLDELAKLEPVILSGGCLGIGTGFGPEAMVKGSLDAYRPYFSRGWNRPDGDEYPVVHGTMSPNYNSAETLMPNRSFRSTYRFTKYPGGRR